MSFSSPLRARRVVLLAASLGAFASGCAAQMDENAELHEDSITEAQDELIIAAPPHPMSPMAFANAFAGVVSPQVKGFSAAAGRDGVVAASISGGWARSGSDGWVAMTKSTPSNVGSVSKYVSGVALMHLLEKRTEKTLEQWLEEPFYKYMPADWQTNMHWTVKQIRIKHLLQHQTGIPDNYTEDPFAFFQAGVTFADIGNTRNYHNLNFKLLTYLIPVMASAATQWFNDYYDDYYGWTNEEVRLRLGRQYHSTMMNTVLPEMPWAISPSCRATMDMNNYALAYDSKNDVGAGQVWDSWVAEEGCRAQGGWYFSAEDLVRFGMAAQNTTYLMSTNARSEMWNTGSGNDYMVFSGVNSYASMLEDFGESRVPNHTGSHSFSGSTAQAVIAVAPDRTVLVALVNSPYPGGTSALRNALIEAYHQSLP